MFGAGDDEIARVRSLRGVEHLAVEDRESAQVLTVTSPSGLELTPNVLACLNGVKVGRIVTREPTLEDAYVSLVTSE